MRFRYAAVVCSQLPQVSSEMCIFNWMPTIRTLFVNVNSVRTRVCSSKPKRVREKQAWRTLAYVIQALFRVIMFGMEKKKKKVKNKRH